MLSSRARAYARGEVVAPSEPRRSGALDGLDATLSDALRSVRSSDGGSPEVREEFQKIRGRDLSILATTVLVNTDPKLQDRVLKARMERKPLRIRVPNDLLAATTANLSKVRDFMSDNRVLLVEGDAESPYQEILLSEEFKLDAKIPPPAMDVHGLTLPAWRAMIAAAVELYRKGKDINVNSIVALNRRLDTDLVRRTLAHKDFGRALELRGVTATWLGLSERQLMALSVLTNYADTASLSAKLKKIDVKPWEFQAWQANPVFRKAYRDASENLFSEAQASINVALTQSATNGDLRSIKYFNELSGRWNPAEQSNTDVRQVLTAVIEILTSTIQDPDLLRTISGKLSAVLVAQGASAPSTRKELS